MKPELDPIKIVSRRMIIAILVFFVLGSACSKVAETSYQTCRQCGSTRKMIRTYTFGFIPRSGAWTVTYASSGFATCIHQWEGGIHTAVPNPIPDGVVVLVRGEFSWIRGRSSYGAFILKDQKVSPERMTYDWVYRTDGLGRMSPSDPAVQSGTTVCKGDPQLGPFKVIQFGPFEINWSGLSEGKGFIYYKRAPGDPVYSAEIPYLCVTIERAIENIDAADPKWHYKSSLVDP